MLWTDAHIEVYFFPRSSIPSDITNKAPTPDKGGWGQPVARFSGLPQTQATELGACGLIRPFSFLQMACHQLLASVKLLQGP